MAPIAVGIAGLVIAAAGTTVAVVGAIKQGQAAQDAADYNKKVADEQANLTIEQMKIEASREQVKNRRALGSIRAAYGAAGVTMDGSPTDLLEYSEMIGQENVNQIKWQGYMKARQLRQQGALSQLEGDNASSASYWKAGAEATKGAGSILKESGLTTKIEPKQVA